MSIPLRRRLARLQAAAGPQTFYAWAAIGESSAEAIVRAHPGGLSSDANVIVFRFPKPTPAEAERTIQELTALAATGAVPAEAIALVVADLRRVADQSGPMARTP